MPTESAPQTCPVCACAGITASACPQCRSDLGIHALIADLEVTMPSTPTNLVTKTNLPRWLLACGAACLLVLSLSAVTLTTLVAQSMARLEGMSGAQTALLKQLLTSTEQPQAESSPSQPELLLPLSASIDQLTKLYAAERQERVLLGQRLEASQLGQSKPLSKATPDKEKTL